jgi:hypothetical protein
MMNLSGKWLMLSKSGTVVEGSDNPEAVSVLAAPGGNIPQDVVDKYDLADQLKGTEHQLVDVAGRPIVHIEGGRAVSIDLLAKDHPARKRAEAAIKDRSLADHPKTGTDAPATTTTATATAKPATAAATTTVPAATTTTAPTATATIPPKV